MEKTAFISDDAIVREADIVMDEGEGMQKVLIIIPAFNEEKSISNLIRSIENIRTNFAYKIEYLVINDCSLDHTLDILRVEKKNYVSLPVNLGIGGGMQCGYLYAAEYGYDVAVQMDADGQHDPEYLDEIVRPVLDGKADMVIGSRFINKEGFQSSAVRRIGIWILSRLVRLVCGADIKDVTSGFRAVNKDVIHFFEKNYAQDYPEPESIVLCAKNKFQIQEVPVVMHERQGGKSSISAMRSFYYMVKVSISILVAGIP